jgi:hypothetical protein
VPLEYPKLPGKCQKKISSPTSSPPSRLSMDISDCTGIPCPQSHVRIELIQHGYLRKSALAIGFSPYSAKKCEKATRLRRSDMDRPQPDRILDRNWRKRRQFGPNQGPVRARYDKRTIPEG